MANVRREEEGEMSIEEILASIRRYVGDEPQPAQSKEESSLPPKSDQQPYVSTKIEAEQTAEALAASLSTTPKPDFKSSPPENVVRLAESYAVRTEPQAPLKPDNQEGLLSLQAQAATAQSFAKLAEVTTYAHHQSKPEAESQTLDQLITSLARPMIKQWLDQNLPRLVELTVTKEIERLTKQLRAD